MADKFAFDEDEFNQYLNQGWEQYENIDLTEPMQSGDIDIDLYLDQNWDDYAEILNGDVVEPEIEPMVDDHDFESAWVEPQSPSPTPSYDDDSFPVVKKRKRRVEPESGV